MLSGKPATFQHPRFLLPPSAIPRGKNIIALPSDLTGPPPPVGSPNFYVRSVDGSLIDLDNSPIGGPPRIEIFEFHTDGSTFVNNTRFDLVQTLTQPELATFHSKLCTPLARTPPAA